MSQRTQKVHLTQPALLLIDNQIGFLHPTYWGRQRSNPDYEKNLERLLAAFRRQGKPIFHVAHHSTTPESPLHPINNKPGVEFFQFVQPRESEPVFVKNVNSAFIGTQLERAIRDAGVTELVIAGLTTDHCVSTSTRMAANLYVTGENGKIYLLEDATATWAKGGWDAETVHQINLASLDDEFAEVVKTEVVVQALKAL